MSDIRVHRYKVEPAERDEFLVRRAELIAAMRTRHPGLIETRLIDLGDGNYLDSWRWNSPAQMEAAFADIPNLPEVPAAMSLTRARSADDGSVIDER